MRVGRSLLATGFLAGLVLTTAGCAGADVPVTTSAMAACSTSSVDAARAAFPGYLVDYEPRSSPDEIAADSDLVVRGRVFGVQAGRTWTVVGGSEARASTTIVLALENADAVKGSLPETGHENVYIELVNPGQRDPEAYERSFGRGCEVVAYLNVASDGSASEGSDLESLAPNEGRPSGEPLYQLSGPQGLLIQATPDDVVWPIIGADLPGRVEDGLPGGTLIAG